jgi:hypothetical protein
MNICLLTKGCLFIFLLQLWDVKYLLEEDDDVVDEKKQEEVAGGSTSNGNTAAENSNATPVSMLVDSEEDTDTEKSGKVHSDTLMGHLLLTFIHSLLGRGYFVRLYKSCGLKSQLR